MASRRNKDGCNKLTPRSQEPPPPAPGQSANQRIRGAGPVPFPYPATICYGVVKTREDLTFGLNPALPPSPVEWRVSDGLTCYEDALAAMEARVAAIAAAT